MNRKLIVLGLVLLPVFIQAQGLEKCPDFVPLSRELNDKFLSQQANLNSTERDLKAAQETNDALHQKYHGCENQPGISDILKKADVALETAKSNTKNALESFTKIEEKVRPIIVDAHGRPVECLYHDPNTGAELGTIVTVIYTLQGDKVETFTKNDPLQPALHQ
jgi:hypothetical protein